MGNEIYYCIGCGSRVSGPDFGGDRSHCARCLGIPVDATPRPGRDSSKRIRKPSSTAMTAVAVRLRPPATATPRRSRALLFGGLSLAGAMLFALGSLFAPAREKTNRLFSQPPAPQDLEKSNRLFSQEAEKTTSLISRESEKTSSLVSRESEKISSLVSQQAEMEAQAEVRHDEIQEAASALADEGRFEDALARIRAFPAEYRNTRAWNSLEGLRRQIEARARSK